MAGAATRVAVDITTTGVDKDRVVMRAHRVALAGIRISRTPNTSLGRTGITTRGTTRTKTRTRARIRDKPLDSSRTIREAPACSAAAVRDNIRTATTNLSSIQTSV